MTGELIPWPEPFPGAAVSFWDYPSATRNLLPDEYPKNQTESALPKTWQLCFLHNKPAPGRRFSVIIESH